ncbi:MAG: hypothetical protein ACRC92_12965 [Peptostreptococcaceae bacterium]
MAKKRKLKKQVVLIISVVSFFIVYFIAFNVGTYLDRKNEEPVKTVEKEEDTRPLITQLGSKTKIYISNSELQNIRIEESYWEEVQYSFSKFAQIRTPEGFEPTYTGYTDDGLKFATDFNYLRVYTVNQEEYYKVPVDDKGEFEKVLKESMYTSFDFVKQYKTWKNVTISYNGDTKSIHKWKFDDLSYKMAAKRLVGKVQPEKSKERSEYNFTIAIKGENYEVNVETMGKDYVKITSGELEAYYEVYTGLFEYIRDDIFKIEGQSKTSE